MEELIEILETISNIDVDEVLFEVYKKDSFQRFAIDINTEEQLRRGLNREGGILGTYSSIGYALDKDKLSGRKAAFFVVDLFVTGRFYRTFKVTPLKDGFEIEAATDIYGDDFDLIYGKVLGISDENIPNLITFVEDIVLEVLNKRLKI